MSKRPSVFVKTLGRYFSTDLQLHKAPLFNTSATDTKSASLYVHWPYCKRKCTYCDFNKYIRESVDHARMKKCLQTEISTLIKKSDIQHVTSVFFGGGTPSLAEPATMAAVLDTVSREASLSQEAEVSMEINPTSIETTKLRNFQLAGVNRASIGVQTLNDDALKMLGRDHNSHASLRCLEIASDVFKRHTSLDLMFGYPGQSLEMWRKELQQILLVCDHHISLYQLTLKRGTQLFKDVAAGFVVMPSSDELADMYAVAIELLASHGFEQYEISNFARENNYGWHNIGYWTGKQYIGVGPGSHGRVWKRRTTDGRLERHACVQTLEPERWMQEVEKFGHATRKSDPQDSRDILEEIISVGLRTKWGVTETNWSAVLPSVPLDKLACSPRTKQWLKSGYLERTEWGLNASPAGLMILDSILPDLLLEIETLLTASRAYTSEES